MQHQTADSFGLILLPADDDDDTHCVCISTMSSKLPTF